MNRNRGQPNRSLDMQQKTGLQGPIKRIRLVELRQATRRLFGGIAEHELEVIGEVSRIDAGEVQNGDDHEDE
jgi:hypothetical protein